MFNRVNDTLYIIYLYNKSVNIHISADNRNTNGRLLALSGFFPMSTFLLLLGTIIYTLHRLHSFTESGIQYLVININYTLEL
jgi:hypothetical protein